MRSAKLILLANCLEEMFNFISVKSFNEKLNENLKNLLKGGRTGNIEHEYEYVIL